MEENEFIEVFSIPLRELLFAGYKKLEAEDYAVDARVGTLAEGIELVRKWESLDWMEALGLCPGSRCIVSNTSRNIHSFILSDRECGNTRTNACDRLP